MSEVLSEVKQVKQNQVDQVKTKLDESSLVVFADYRGLSVSEVTELRRKARENEAEVKIYKNTLTRRALDSLEFKYSKDLVFGPSMMFTTQTGVVNLSKVLVNFAKDAETFTIKGGFLDKLEIPVDTVNDLAKLPTRDVLVAKSVSLIKAPLNALVGNLASPIRGLVYVLQQIKENKNQED